MKLTENKHISQPVRISDVPIGTFFRYKEALLADRVAREYGKA